MISVNQKFKDSCNNANVQSQFKLYLSQNKNSNVLTTLNDDEFIIDSGSIEKQASSGAVLNIGGVCSNRIKVTLTQKGVEKVNNVNGFKKNYALHLVQWNRVDDANQSPSDFSKNLDDSENITGKCDLGFYYISEIDNNYYSCVLTCYDGMIAFQRNFTITQIKYLKNNSKTVDEWLAYFCSLVNDSNFLIAYTDNSEVTCNDGVSFSLSDDVDFDTMREAISQLAMLKMAYATIDSLGNLTLKPAIKTNTSTYDDTVANQYMFSCDNEVKESVIKYFYTSVAGFEYENTYQDQEGRNEINIYLEENKFLRGFEPYNGSAMSSSSLTCLRNMAQAVMGYSFYSCECEVNERPYIELGDNIQVQRRLVDTEGTVTQISIPVVVDNLSHSLGSTTHLSSNSTVSTNSSSSGKMNLNGGGYVNSKIKEPSTNDLVDAYNSPVKTYTDTTATVKIRIDDNTIERMSSPSNLSNYTRTLKEYTDSSYYFDSKILRADLDTIRLKLHKKITIKSLKSLIGLELHVTSSDLIPQSQIRKDGIAKITSITTTGDIGAAREIYGGGALLTARNNENIINTFINSSGDTLQSAYVILHDFMSNNYDVSNQGVSEEENIDTTASITLSQLRSLNGYTVKKIDNQDDILEKMYNMGNAIVAGIHIEFDITYEETTYMGTPHYPYLNTRPETTNISDIIDIYDYLTTTYAAIGPDVSEATQIINTVYNSVKLELNRYYVECTYLTENAPLDEGDKIAADSNIVTKDDFEDLSSQVNANTQAISDLKEDLTNLDSKLSTDINNVNNDLQDTKQDIATNTQNIATNTGNIAALDDRVDALENNAVEANPSETSTATLTKLKVNDVVYDVPSGGGGGGTTVIANPSGQASADLEKLQVGSVIYGIAQVEANPSGQGTETLNKIQIGSTIYNIPSGGGGASHDEIVVTSEHNITLLGNGRTHMNYDKILYQEGNSFINYDVTTGFWTVSEDTLMSVEIQSSLESYGNAWLTYRIFEANTANINDTTGTQGQIYYCYTFGFTEFPIIKCRPNYYYFVAAYKANSGNWTMTKSENNSTTGLYQMKNFAKFVKKNGVYTPT
jgi:hypothetical protein